MVNFYIFSWNNSFIRFFRLLKRCYFAIFKSRFKWSFNWFNLSNLIFIFGFNFNLNYFHFRFSFFYLQSYLIDF
jgi:hypothetical protein